MFVSLLVFVGCGILLWISNNKFELYRRFKYDAFSCILFWERDNSEYSNEERLKILSKYKNKHQRYSNIKDMWAVIIFFLMLGFAVSFVVLGLYIFGN